MKYFITTPIFYANAKLHIAHVYTGVVADILARFHRQKKDDVFFLTGMDEHGDKIYKKALAEGGDPQNFCDRIAREAKKTWKSLDISYDKFIRTTDKEHEEGVQFILNNLYKKDYIYQRDYEGLYCEGCEKFITKKELVNGKCPEHDKKPTLVKEKNYFFRLANYLPQIKKSIDRGELLIKPEARKNEILKILDQGLEDFSVSRESAKWGIDLPFDKKEKIYVWVDALANYITALNYGKEEREQDLFARYWPADLHLVGKDILKFHAIYWPAILLALKLPLPKQIYAHGFLTISGKKMSKTLGNVIDPDDLVRRWGSDAVRYLLISQFPLGKDGDISLAKMEASYKADLANDLGNLLQRTLIMLKKYKIKPTINDFAFNEKKFVKHMNDLEINKALEMIKTIISSSNVYIEEKKPWKLFKEDSQAAGEILNNLYSRLKIISRLIYPFMPKTSLEIARQLKTMDPEPIFKKN